MNHFVCRNVACQSYNGLLNPCSMTSDEKIEKPIECPHLLDDAKWELETVQEELKM